MQTERQSAASDPERKPAPIPGSIDETLDLLAGADYVADRGLATVLFLALRLGRPLFLEGEAGVGKTEIAKVLATALGRRLIRLQCYEGLDVASAVYEWNYAGADDRDPPRRGGRRGRPRAARTSDIFSERFLIKRPLLQALEPDPRRRAGPADRRARPHRRGVRGLPAGGAVRLPGDDPGARHDQGRRSRRSSSSPPTARARSTTR